MGGYSVLIHRPTVPQGRSGGSEISGDEVSCGGPIHIIFERVAAYDGVTAHAGQALIEKSICVGLHVVCGLHYARPDQGAINGCGSAVRSEEHTSELQSL